MREDGSDAAATKRQADGRGSSDASAPVNGLYHHGQLQPPIQTIDELSSKLPEPYDERDDDDEDMDRIENKRTSLLDAVRNLNPADTTADGTAYSRFKQNHRSTVESCILDSENRSETTLLHFLAIRLVKKDIKDGRFKLLVKLILEIGKSQNPHILCVRSLAGNSTCLHKAIDVGKDDFVMLICDNAEPGHLSDAIGLGDAQGQTCLHMAITSNKPNLDLIQTLVSKANADTILTKRTGGDKHAKEYENTALHDFVDFRMCNLPVRKCLKEYAACSTCTKGPEIRDQEKYWYILQKMLDICPDAMKILNAAGQSPYMFHISTKKAIMPKWNHLEFSEAVGKDGLMGNGATQATTEPTHWKPKPEYSESFATKVAMLLMNRSLSQEKYSDACTCLFGKSKSSLHSEQDLQYSE